MEVGPVDVYIIGFPGNKFSGKIAPAIQELVDNGTIRILDLLFVMKDEDGSVATVPCSSFMMNSRSRMRIVPLSTSSLIAGAILPLNLLPGKPMM